MHVRGKERERERKATDSNHNMSINSIKINITYKPFAVAHIICRYRRACITIIYWRMMIWLVKRNRDFVGIDQTDHKWNMDALHGDGCDKMFHSTPWFD